MGLGRIQSKTDYEDLRNARILENKSRLKTLGLQNTISELRSLATPTRQSKTTPTRKWTRKIYENSSLRRSDRLKKIPATPESAELEGRSPRRLSRQFRTRLFEPFSDKDGDVLKEAGCLRRETSLRTANMPLLDLNGFKAQLTPEASAFRCHSKGRGAVYNSTFGICCHFCRQKKLCGEEDCKRCGDFDVDEPCIGKTDCSVCHSTNGVLCRACLKVRYGEEMEDVIANKQWMCPHCIEENGSKPFWICNSSFCLKKRKIAPTGIAIYRAQELGYKSVAHLLMDELQGLT